VAVDVGDVKRLLHGNGEFFRLIVWEHKESVGP